MYINQALFKIFKTIKILQQIQVYYPRVFNIAFIGKQSEVNKIKKCAFKRAWKLVGIKALLQYFDYVGLPKRKKKSALLNRV